MSWTSSPWENQVTRALTGAGESLGLKPADFRKQVAPPWMQTPVVAYVGQFGSGAHSCVAGTWRGRRSSAMIQLPVGLSHRTMATRLRDSYSWSEGQLLITSVGFVSGVIPLMAATPTKPFRINEYKTYEPTYWLPGLAAQPVGNEIPVPGDVANNWSVRAVQAAKPSAILAAIAPMLLSESAYPWKIDGGRNGSHVLDLVRVDIRMPDTPPPTAELLEGRLDRLSQMAATIEEVVGQFRPGTYA